MMGLTAIKLGSTILDSAGRKKKILGWNGEEDGHVIKRGKRNFGVLFIILTIVCLIL